MNGACRASRPTLIEGGKVSKVFKDFKDFKDPKDPKAPKDPKDPKDLTPNNPSHADFFSFLKDNPPSPTLISKRAKKQGNPQADKPSSRLPCMEEVSV